jgi:acetyl esterase/lipase
MQKFPTRPSLVARRRRQLTLESLECRAVLSVGIDAISPDTGRSANDHVTSATALTFRGFASPASLVSLREQGAATILGTAVADQNGRWEIAPSGQNLADGQHTFTAATVAEVSNNFTVVVDTRAPKLAPLNAPPRSGEDAGLQVVSNFVHTSPAAYGEQSAVQFQTVGNSVPALFSSPPRIDAAGALRYQTAPDANGDATITVRAIDLAGNVSATQTFPISVWAVNDPPVIHVHGSLQYTENGSPVLVDPNATVTDVDSANFSRGMLYVTNVHADIRDQLVVLNEEPGPGKIWVSPAKAVVYGNDWIGNVVDGVAVTPGGTGATPFMVKFNSKATPEAVQALIRRIAYYSPSENPTSVPRTITFQVTDDYVSPNVTYKTADGRNLQMSIALPADWQPGKQYPTVVFAGGTWFEAGTVRYDERGRYLTSRDVIVAQVDYRVIEQYSNQSPDVCIEDMKSAVRWLRQNADQFGVDPNRVAVAGASMGGFLASAVAMVDGFENPAEDLSISSKPNAAILFNPVLDNGPDGWGQQWIGDRYPEMSPAYNVSSDDPPTLLMVGTEDRGLPMKLVQKFIDNMSAAGVPLTTHLYEGYPHVYANIEQYYGENWYKNLLDIDGFLSGLGWISGPPTLEPPAAYAVAANLPESAAVPQVPLSVIDVNDAPRLSNLPATQSFVENSLPVFVSTSARVFEDSPDFQGGSLVVANARGDVRDRLQLWNEGDGPGQVGVSGSVVRYGSFTIGNVSGGAGTTPLVVNFNSAAATPMAVQHVLYRLGFQSFGDNVLAGSRHLTFTLRDKDGLRSDLAFTDVNVVAVNDAPVLANVAAANFPADGTPVLLFANATLTDADSANFDTGSLQVHFTAGAMSGNRLTLGSAVDASGQVSVDGTVVGTLVSNGVGLNDLVVAFNPNATVPRVEQLLQLVQFSTDVRNVQRQLSVALSDGDGGWASASVSVYFPAAITGVSPDRGRSASDRITNTGKVRFDGIGYPGDTVTLVQSSGAVLGKQVVDPAGNWSIDLTNQPLNNGRYSLSLQTSSTARSAAPPTWVAFTVDTTDPSFQLPSGNVFSAKNAGPQKISGFATSLSAGPGESVPVFFGVVTNSNPSLFVVQPAIDSQGTLTYQSRTSAVGSATITIKAVDLAGNATAEQTFSIHILDNRAPVLSASAQPSFGSFAEDTPASDIAGELVGNLLKGNATDSDGDSLGMAVVSLGSPRQGDYQYRLNGGNWMSMPSVSETSALLLPASASVRFVPKADMNGTVSFYFRAWDGSGGTAGGIVDLTSERGGKGFASSAYAKAICTVTPVDDAPTLTPSLASPIGYTRGQAAVLLLGATTTVRDVDSATFAAGQLQVTGVAAGDVLSLGGRFSFQGTSVLYSPDGQSAIVIGTRNAGGGEGANLTIQFASTATLDLVQRLVRSLQFRTTGATGARSLQVSLSDDQQQVSNVVSCTVSVS